VPTSNDEEPLMATIADLAYNVTSELFGPDARVPWWAWLALLVMIFWGLLVPQRQDS
jgi:hypothetical protein